MWVNRVSLTEILVVDAGALVQLSQRGFHTKFSYKMDDVYIYIYTYTYLHSYIQSLDLSDLVPV